MSELRWDPLDQRACLIAPERGLRPTDFLPVVRRAATDAACPLCLLQDHQGTNTRIAERAVPGSDDRLLVVANLYPALALETPLARRAAGPYGVVAGLGAHEVIIETVHHDLSWTAYSAAHFAALLDVWRDRVADLQNDHRLAHIQVFRNGGPHAGASLGHAHSQLIAAPTLPSRQRQQRAAQAAYWHTHERCLTCDLLAWEDAAAERVLIKTDYFIAFCPFASRHAFEIHVSPRAHVASLIEHDAAQRADLAQLLAQLVPAQSAAIDGADVNLTLLLPPNINALNHHDRELFQPTSHWRLELIPRLVPYGGFELATDLIINPVAPEAAAHHLRALGLEPSPA